MRLPRAALAAAFAAWQGTVAAAAPLPLVAAENVYGDVASQIGGPAVAVTSILHRPGQDPHLFEASASVARAVADAAITVSEGGGYDPWMASLLAASPRAGRRSIVVAGLMHSPAGSNPHLWYDPATMPVVAAALAQAMADLDPADAPRIAVRRQAFKDSLNALGAKIAALRARFAGAPVAATEPVFSPMAAALGLSMHEAPFQLAVMNGTEPAASAVARFEDDLRGRRVRALLVNTQVSDAAAGRLASLARQSGVPVVGVTETLPEGQTYQSWMLGELGALEAALAARP
jgi:zinc/manganese transport system substrate-binding protein